MIGFLSSLFGGGSTTPRPRRPIGIIDDFKGLDGLFGAEVPPVQRTLPEATPEELEPAPMPQPAAEPNPISYHEPIFFPDVPRTANREVSQTSANMPPPILGVAEPVLSGRLTPPRTCYKIWQSPAQIRERDARIQARQAAQDRAHIHQALSAFGGFSEPADTSSPASPTATTAQVAANHAQPTPTTPTKNQSKTPSPSKPTWRVNDGKNPHFNRLLAEVRAVEGGFANRPKTSDPGGPTNKGMSQKFLNIFNRAYPSWNLPKQSKNLTDEQIDGIYRFEFFDRPKLDKVANISGIHPKFISQIFDAGVLHGTGDFGKWLQAALDKHLGTDLTVKGTGGAGFTMVTSVQPRVQLFCPQFRKAN